MAVSESEISYAASTHLARVAEHAGSAVLLRDVSESYRLSI